MSRQQDFQRPADSQVVINHQYFSNFRSHCQIKILYKDTTFSEKTILEMWADRNIRSAADNKVVKAGSKPAATC